MDRKKFLKKIGIGVVAGTPLILSCRKNKVDPEKEDCKLTGDDVLGPFFVEGSPNIVNLNTQNLPGVPMMMNGKIFSGEGENNPIEGAKVEIWHADDKGVYHPEGSGEVDNYDPSEITLRGFVLTESDGSFAFQSIRPGLYGRRARHIHFKITANGHEELVTQSYFDGDNRIPEDYFAKDAGDCRVITYQDNGNGGIVGTMNFNIRKS